MPRQLTQLKLNEVSLVDSPANKLARIMMFKRGPQDGNYPSSVLKREFTAEERKTRAASGHAMPDGSFPIDNKGDLENAIRAIGRAKNPAKAKAHIKTRARALGATDMLPDTWEKRDSGVAVMKFFITKDASLAKYGSEAVDFDTAQACAEECEAVSGLMQEVNEAVCSLGSSIWSIQGDDSVSDKGAAINQSLEQFSDHVKTIVPEGVENALVAQALSEAGFRLNALGGIELSKGDDSMSMKEIAKALGLPENTPEADITAAVIKTAKTEVDELKKKLADAELIVKMSAKHKAYMDGGGKMPEGGKEKFAAMTPEQRDAHMGDNETDEDDVEKSIKKGDAFRTHTGVVVTKKDYATETAFNVAKAAEVENAALRAQVAKAADDSAMRARVDFAKSDLTMVGKPEELGQLLHDIGKLDPAKGPGVADRVATVLKGVNLIATQSDLFKQHGRGSAPLTGSAAEKIGKLAGELVAKDGTGKMTIEKARGIIRKSNPELRKQEEEEQKASQTRAA